LQLAFGSQGAGGVIPPDDGCKIILNLIRKDTLIKIKSVFFIYIFTLALIIIKN
jgi:hypothetical protein